MMSASKVVLSAESDNHWVQRYLRSILPTLRSITHFVEEEVSIFLWVGNPQITY